MSAGDVARDVFEAVADNWDWIKEGLAAVEKGSPKDAILVAIRQVIREASDKEMERELGLPSK